jgi:hypothetical protein
VPALRTILDRFRLASAPGRAGAAAVPSRTRRTPDSELAAVFAALDGTQNECAAIEATARRRAGAISDDAHTRAARIGEQARMDADRNRRDVITAANAAAARAQAAELDAARASAARVYADGRARLAPLAARAVALVRGLAGTQ